MRAMESTRRKLEAFEVRGFEDKRFWRSWRHQKHLFRSSSPEADVIRGYKDHQKLEDWRTSNVVQMMIESHLSLQKIGRIKQQLFQMNLKALNDYQLRALKKDICTKCTTTISTTLFLCLLVQEQQLCLQRCSSRLGMDLKLIFHRTITKSGNRSLVI